MRFEALELSLTLIALLREPVRTLARRNPELYRQLRKSLSSVPLNLAEGAGRFGKDGRQHFRIAYGSARESHAALRAAVAWGDLKAEAIEHAMPTFDRLLRLLWGLGR